LVNILLGRRGTATLGREAKPRFQAIQTYTTGTALTSLDGITFSLMGGPVVGSPPLIGFDSDPPRGLTNSTNPDYPTANILDFSFSTPVSGVSFYFDNYSNNGTSYYAAFNSTGTLIKTGNVSSDQGLGDIVLTASGIKDLQFNNGETSSTSWYFRCPFHNIQLHLDDS